MRFINPYQGVSFNSVSRVKAISHEHIVSTEYLKRCYDRGIRYFAAINYTPAAVSYPLQGFSQTVKDWCYIDISQQFPQGGDNGDDKYSPLRARGYVPSFYSYHQQGLVITYKNLSNERVYEKLTSDPTGIEWYLDVCSNDGMWTQFQESELGSKLELLDCLYENSFPSFVDKDGVTIQTSSLVQLPNAEHTRFRYDFEHFNYQTDHLNILGTLWNEPSHSYRKSNSFTYDYPIYDLNDVNDIVLNEQNQLFRNKIFGTINHTKEVDAIEKVLQMCPNIFKAMELFNQCHTPQYNQQCRNAYDAILKSGFRIWGTSSVDWQGTYEILPTPTPTADLECDFDRGCNVLLIDGYESLADNALKSEAGLDAYISGRYYMSGLGDHYINALQISNNVVTLEVDGSPSTIKAITSERVVNGSGNHISVKIQPGEKYIRFEVFYYDSGKQDMDFIFTNPIFIEDNDADNKKEQAIILGII